MTIEFMRILDAFGGEEEAEKISTMNNVFPFHSMSFMAIAFGAQFMDLKNVSGVVIVVANDSFEIFLKKICHN